MKLRLKPWIKDLPEYVAGRTIGEIKKRYNLSEVYKLASNENIFGPCKEVKEYLKNNLDDLNYYPDCDAVEIRQKLAEKYQVNPANIIMGNGTDQIIEMICDCFIDKNDNVVTADPNFLIYEKATLKCGGEVIKIPLNKKDFRQNIEKMVNSVNEKTKVVFLASPHNPTGTIIYREELDYAVSSLNDDVLIVMDEAYCEYLASEYSINTIDYVIKNPNVITLRTFSKIYGLAGLRIGYGIADSEIIAGLNKIRLPFNVSLISQKAAIKALENDWYVQEIRDGILNEKEKFYGIFSSEGIEYLKSYANFILVKTGIKSQEIIEMLLQKGFIVRPGMNLGIPGYIRVTVSTPDINDRFLSSFIEIYRFFYK